MIELPSIRQLQSELEQGLTSSEQLTRDALDRIEDSAGQGAKVFTQVYADQAMQAARASDILRAAGLARSPLEGLPVSVKDLFDVRGEVTLAGSVVLKNEPPASRHASVVQRLLDAGAILVGRTNMTEFAYSGLGLNPHYGTPSSPWDRANERIPGGSSSGAGVAVAERMSVMSLGTDTGGSIRIPAAFNGVTGFKPTARRIPSDGGIPLSFSLDSSGPLAATVECCAITDAILAGQPAHHFRTPAPAQVRVAVPDSLVLEDADSHVLDVFEQTLAALRSAGVQVDMLAIPEFEQLAYINRKGGLIAAEAWAWHQPHIERDAAAYDPLVVSRMRRGSQMSAADYIEVLQARSAWIAAVEARLAHVDALLMPVSPIVAPAIADLQADPDEYFRSNATILRNPTFINFLDGCGLSIPCHPAGTAPVGLMVAGPAMRDAHILNVGRMIEDILRSSRG